MLQKILNFSLYAAILLSPLYLVRFSVFNIPTNILDLLIVACAFLWIWNRPKLSFLTSLSKIYWLSFLLIFLGITISALLNSNLDHSAGIIKSWFVLPFFFFLILLDQINSPEKIDKMMRFFFVSSASVGLISLGYLFFNELTFDGRLKAFYLSPNHLAMFLAPGIVVGILSIFRTNKKSAYFLFPSLLILLIALYFTFSYGTWLALFFSLIITLLISNIFEKLVKIKILSALVILFLILSSFQFQNPKIKEILSSRSSLTSRIMIWEAAWKIGSDNLVWGIGAGNFQEKYLAYQNYFPPYLEWAVPQPHNLYLAFWLQGGILGLVGFLTLIVSWLTQMVKFVRQQKKSFLQIAPFSVILYFLLHGLIDTPYWKNDLALLFWFFLALGWLFFRQAQAEKMAIGPIDEK